jgi:hypothetical protein
MAKKFSELEARMSPEARARVEKKVQAALTEMSQNELRNVRGLQEREYETERLDQKAD